MAAGHAIYPQGGGTAIDYGGIPRRPGVAVDIRCLDRLIDYPSADMTITVQAGMTLSALRAILAEQHQRLLVDAPDPDRATLGGIYATNTTGPRRFGAGRPRDQIIGVSFVTSEGAVVKGGGRVVKNVAGYDFPKLLTGSMGTLGIIAQLTLKVRPIPEASAIAWVPLRPARSPPPSCSIGSIRPRPGPSPWTCSTPRPPGRSARRSGFPANTRSSSIGFEDNADSVRWQIDRLKSEVGRTDLMVVEGEQTLPALGRPSTVSRRSNTGPSASWQISARPSVAGFVEGLDPGRWSVQAHAGNGIVRAHALGEWTLDEAARTDRALPSAGRPRRRQPDPLALPDRLEGAPSCLGRAPGRLGDRRSRPRRPRSPRGHEPGAVRGGVIREIPHAATWMLQSGWPDSPIDPRIYGELTWLPLRSIRSTPSLARRSRTTSTEVVDGRIVEKPMGAYKCWFASVLFEILTHFVRANTLGRVLQEMIFDLRPHVDRERRPNVAFVSHQRWARDRGVPWARSWAVIPDLVP